MDLNLSLSNLCIAHMIQLYEQKKNAINKAQAITLARMANVLGCTTADLMECE